MINILAKAFDFEIANWSYKKMPHQTVKLQIEALL